MSMPNFDAASPSQIASANLTQDEAMELIRGGYVTDPSVASDLFKYSVGKGPSQQEQVASEMVTEQQAKPQYYTPMQNATADSSVGAPQLSQAELLQLEQDEAVSQSQDQLAIRKQLLDQALQEQMSAGQTGNDQLSEAYKAHAANLKNTMGQLSSLDQQREDRYSYALGQYEAARKEADDFIKNKKGFWETRTDGQKALALIAVALGGFVEGFTGGKVRDGASDILQAHIKNYINDQELQYNKIKDKQESAQNLFSMIQRQTNDREQTRRLMMEMGLKSTEAMIDSVAKSGEAKQKAAQLKTQLAEKAFNIEKENEEALRKQSLTPTQQKAAGMDVRFVPPQDEKLAKTFINGFGTGFAGTNREKVIEDYIMPAKETADAVDRLLTLASTSGGLTSFIEQSDAGEVDALVDNLRASLRSKLVGPGTLSETDQKKLKESISNPLSLAEYLESDLKARARFRTYARLSVEAAEKRLELSGYKLSPEFEQYKSKFGTNVDTSNNFERRGTKQGL